MDDSTALNTSGSPSPGDEINYGVNHSSEVQIEFEEGACELTVLMEGVPLRRVRVEVGRRDPEHDVIFTLDEVTYVNNQEHSTSVYSCLVNRKGASAEASLAEASALISHARELGLDVDATLVSLGFSQLDAPSSDWVKKVQDGHFIVYDGHDVYDLRSADL